MTDTKHDNHTIGPGSDSDNDDPHTIRPGTD